MLMEEFVTDYLKRHWMKEIFDLIVKCPWISAETHSLKKRYCVPVQSRRMSLRGETGPFTESHPQ